MFDETKPEEETEAPKEEALVVELEETEAPEDQPEQDVSPEDESDSELTITVGDGTPDEYADIEAQLGDSGKVVLSKLRATQRESAKRIREQEARIAEIEARAVAAEMQALAMKPAEPLKRPTREDCDYDDDVFAQKMEEYVRKSAEIERAAKQQEESEKAKREDYAARLAGYQTRKEALRVSDFEEAEKVVAASLTVAQQNIIIRCAEDPAKLVYALGKSPKARAALASITDGDRFAHRLAKIEGEIKVTQKAPPPPETKLKVGTGAGAVMGTADLEKLRQAAERSGDYTAYFRAKDARKAAGVRT